jgi:hypothetical protein
MGAVVLVVLFSLAKSLANAGLYTIVVERVVQPIGVPKAATISMRSGSISRCPPRTSEYLRVTGAFRIHALNNLFPWFCVALEKGCAVRLLSKGRRVKLTATLNEGIKKKAVRLFRH